ncbi:Carboxypeptidase regulatory-like domain-containing protein [Sulfidibacter corallicola]|uniref:Carboxypeptidase regulatory-like domain-containing protein n=1 Tax=Sulfidibacter corallicola TaxID=2818388 RepID=A0A8A4TIC0_SULCO|nr:carboxypeptidase-like regulatory domain-containing protein [Sulfidibacter corallicola]QTD48581.1 carboxypeptidase regulatory-like domain-containing protein [Sulfidibacter corallicola]
MSEERKSQELAPNPSNKERTAVFVFGVILVFVFLGLIIFVPDPTPFQYTVFRIVLSLAAAGVATFIPGLINVEIRKIIRAGGAIAVFVIVYFYAPAGMPTGSKPYRLFITVLNQEGLPVSNAKITTDTAEQIRKLDNAWELVVRDRKAGDTVNIYAAFGFTQGKESVVLGGDKEYRISITLKKRTDGIISGRVTDQRGHPLSGVFVSVLGHEPDGIRTDDQGHFKLKTHAAPGEEVRVTAESDNLSWSGYIPAGGSVEIRLNERNE